VRSTDNGQVSSLVLLDLSSAFDTVDHEILLTVLSTRFSVCGTAATWFHSYLEDHPQMFHYSGETSSTYSLDCSVPQGSVLGPIGFISYTEDVVDIINRHRVRSHFYTDDMQLYASCLPDNVGGVMSLLSTCAADIAQWCASRRLQMNSDKTDLILFGSHVNLAIFATHDCSLQIGSDTIVPATVVRVLGVQLDAELSMKAYITKTTASCLYHLHRLRQIRRRAGEDVTTRLVQAFIKSRLDYCNSLLAGLPRSSLDPLQRVQNAAARLIFQLGPQDHVTPSRIQLHWLPVHYRVQFKLCSFMHSIHNGRSPAYLTDIVQATSTRSTRSGLRSAATTNYILPRLRTKFGERAFSYAGPAAGNAVPPDLRNIPASTTFKRQLKTHFLKLLIVCCSSNFDSCNAHMYLIVMCAMSSILSLTLTICSAQITDDAFVVRQWLPQKHDCQKTAVLLTVMLLGQPLLASKCIICDMSMVGQGDSF
jgi:hypothetical protein